MVAVSQAQQQDCILKDFIKTTADTISDMSTVHSQVDTVLKSSIGLT